jgi:hypothetical protein
MALIFDRPSGTLASLGAKNPAINRGASIVCPSGTMTVEHRPRRKPRSGVPCVTPGVSRGNAAPMKNPKPR